VHRFESIIWLKKILGDTLQIVYIDVELAVRKERSCDALNILAEKERTKEQRRTGCVKEVADLVLNNNGSVKQTRETLGRYLGAADRRSRG